MKNTLLNKSLLIPLLSLAGAGLCVAQSTWVGGGGNDDLSNAANWKGGQLPPLDDPNKVIAFDSADHLTPRNDYVQSAGVIFFEPATAGMTLSGDPMQVGNTAPANNHAIIVNGAGTRTMDIDLQFTGRKGFFRNICVDPSATLILNGTLSSNQEVPAYRYFILRKWIGGTLVINGDNSLPEFVDFEAGDGTTFINNKTGSGLGDANATVKARAALGGEGTISGNLVVSGSLQPGASGNGSIGTFTVNGGVTWKPHGKSFDFDLGEPAATQAAAASGGSTQDQLIIGGDFLRDAQVQPDFDFQGGGTRGWYKLIQWAGTSDFTEMDFTASNLAPGLGGEFSIQDNALYLHVTP
jgi:hypothetical protein